MYCRGENDFLFHRPTSAVLVKLSILIFSSSPPGVSLARYFGCFLFFLTKKDCTVYGHLCNLTDMEFLLFTMYRINKTSFMPAQNYYNTMSMIKSIFISVLTGQQEGIEEYFMFLDASDRTEVAFCILRSLFSGANFDAVQFVERVSSVMTIQSIFARSPEKERASRHLVMPDPKSGVATTDHMNPLTYLRVEDDEGGTDRSRVPIKPGDCDVAKAHNGAATRIRIFLLSTGVPREEVAFDTIAEGDVDMMRPFGSWVGVSTVELDDDEAEGQNAAGADDDDDNAGNDDDDDADPTLEMKLSPTPDTPGKVAPTPRRISDPGLGDDVSMESAFKAKFEGKAKRNSTDRCRRVMNDGKDGSSASAAVVIDHAGVPTVQAGIGPIIGLVYAGSFATIAAMIPISFTSADGRSSLLEMPVAELEESASKVCCQIIPLTRSRDDTLNVVATVGSFCGIIEVDGPATSVIDPKTICKDDGTMQFAFEIEDLDVAAGLLYERLKASSDSTPTLTPLPSSITRLPYENFDGEPLFVIEGTQGGQGAVSARRRRKKDGEERMFECVVPGCGQTWAEGKLMTHVGMHQVRDSDQLPSLACGVCGMGETMQYTTDGTSTGCVTWMETKDGKLTSKAQKPNWVPEIRCKNFGEFTFSLAVAKHVNSRNPCTNTLEFCTACPSEPVPTVYFTYDGGDEANNPKGLRYHYSTKHTALELPTRRNQGTSEDERADVLRVGKDPPKKRASKKRSATSNNAAAGGGKAAKVAASDSDDSSEEEEDDDDNELSDGSDLEGARAAAAVASHGPSTHHAENSSD